MLKLVGPHLRRNLVAYLALFAALGGSAYAAVAIPRNSIGSGKIKNNSLRGADVRKNSLRGADVRNNSLTGKDIAEPTLHCAAIPGCAGGGSQGATGPAGPGVVCQGNSAADVMVKAGAVCIDKYEDSLWTAPTGGTQITGDVPCAADGHDCTNIYARSVAGVTPRANITWYQAQQALANVGKRLPTSAEWQQAAAGTPAGAPCHVSGAAVADTGASTGCVSNWGANDMVGNLWEWVADWVLAQSPNFPAAPDAVLRGGSFMNAGSSPFATAVDQPVSSSSFYGPFGFRGAR